MAAGIPAGVSRVAGILRPVVVEIRLGFVPRHGVTPAAVGVAIAVFGRGFDGPMLTDILDLR